MRVENKNAVYNILGIRLFKWNTVFFYSDFHTCFGPGTVRYCISIYYLGEYFLYYFWASSAGKYRNSNSKARKKGNKRVSIYNSYYRSFVFFLLFIVFLLFYEVISKLLLMSHTVLYLMVIQSIGTFVIAFSGIAFVFYKKAKNSFMINVTTAISTTVLSLLLSLLLFSNQKVVDLGKMYGMVIPIILIATGITVYFIKENWRCFNFNI